MTKKNSKIIRATPKKLSISAPAAPKSNLYDVDFYKWTKTQATLLKKKQISELDFNNLREEIESLGKNDKRSLRSQTTRLLMHLLKKKFQPEMDTSNSWNSTITDATREIKYLIKDSPSLRNELSKIYMEAYEDAREDAANETKLNIKIFPKESLWKLDELFPDLSKKMKKNKNA